MTFGIWFLLLSIIFSRFVSVEAWISNSFLFTGEWYSIVWLYHICLAIHQLMNICVIYTFQLLLIMQLWTPLYKLLCGYLFTFLVYTPRTEIIGSYETSYLTFWEASILFSIVAAPFYIPASHLWGYWFLHILTNTCYFSLFYYSYGISLWFDLHFLND